MWLHFKWKFWGIKNNDWLWANLSWNSQTKESRQVEAEETQTKLCVINFKYFHMRLKQPGAYPGIFYPGLNSFLFGKKNIKGRGWDFFSQKTLANWKNFPKWYTQPPPPLDTPLDAGKMQVVSVDSKAFSAVLILVQKFIGFTFYDTK